MNIYIIFVFFCIYLQHFFLLLIIIYHFNFVLCSRAYHHIHKDQDFYLIPMLFEKLFFWCSPPKTDHHVIFQNEKLILLICEGNWGGWNIFTFIIFLRSKLDLQFRITIRFLYKLCLRNFFRASRDLTFQKFSGHRANHGGPSGDGELSADLTDNFFEKLATM